LDFHPAELLNVVGIATVQRVESLPFPVIADILSCFARLKQPFPAEPEFWAVLATKVPGSRMASLCPAFQAVVQLGVDAPRLHEALLEELLKGVKEAPVASPPQPFGTILQLWDNVPKSPSPLPAFAHPVVPKRMLPLAECGRIEAPTAVHETSEVIEEDSVSIIEFPSDGLELEGQLGDTEPEVAPRMKGSWYSASARCPLSPVFPGYSQFDADDMFARNRRGSRIGEALEALNELWQRRRASAVTTTPVTGVDKGVAQPSDVSEQASQLVAESSDSLELQFVKVALPVIQTSLQGLKPHQLVACAELCTAAPAHTEVMRDIVQEGVRRLSGFQPQELRRLREAALSHGLCDPYLERARRRRFPKALRKELRDEEEAMATATAKA